MFVWEIRERLVRDGVCKPTSLPSLTTLTRMLRDAGVQHIDERTSSAHDDNDDEESKDDKSKSKHFSLSL